jgi:hypothetical protein
VSSDAFNESGSAGTDTRELAAGTTVAEIARRGSATRLCPGGEGQSGAELPIRGDECKHAVLRPTKRDAEQATSVISALAAALESVL